MVRLLKYLTNTLLLLASLVGLVLIFLYFAPGPLIRPLANTYLNTVGFPIESVAGAKFTFKESRVADLTISNQQNTFILHNLELNYRFSELLRGKVESLRIETVTLLFAESAVDESDPDSSLADLLEQVKLLPLSNIIIGNLNFNDQLALSNLSIHLSPDNFDAALNYEEFALTGTGDWSDSSNLRGNVSVARAEQLLSSTDYDLALRGQALTWQGQTQLALTSLQDVPGLQAVFASHRPENDLIQLTTEFTVDGVLSELVIPSYSVMLSGPEESDLVVNSQLDAGQLTSNINLPIRLSGSAVNYPDALDFTLEAFANRFTWQADSLTASGNLSTHQINGSCSLQMDCTTKQQLQLSVDKLELPDMAELSELNFSFLGEFSVNKSGDLIGLVLDEQSHASLTGLAFESLQVGSVDWHTLSSGSVEYELSSNTIAMAIAASQIQLKDLQSSSVTSQISLDLDKLEINLAERLSSRFDFSSSTLQTGLENYSPVDPGINGSFTFQNNTVELASQLTVNNRQVMNKLVSHDLNNGSGNASIEIAELLFSNITPLSSYFEDLPESMELISGTIGARAQLNWQISQQDEIQLRGPLELTIENLGGFYNEIIFVGFQTQVLAQVNSTTAVQSTQLLEASLANLDVGTAMENIRWNYQFDSTVPSATLEAFYAELLGGSISVSNFEYQPQRARNLLSVDMNGLQLNTISAMADYPNLYVDGAISGRLPIVISADTVKVDQGAIAAMQPGGIIRYKPSNPAPNPNSTMQLVNDALSNYHYSRLESDVIYEDNGDLVLAVRMQGRNPDMNGGQEINLNLNITDNIPTLLRSLQASRVITDTLEQTLQQRQQERQNNR